MPDPGVAVIVIVSQTYCLVSFKCNGDSQKHTAGQTDVGEAVKYGVEGQKCAASPAQGHGD